jgi:hypothetical protein
MSTFKAFLAIGAIAMATLIVGNATPASASPIGTTYDFETSNFQGDGGRDDIVFGFPAYVPGSGVIINSSVSTSVPVPGLTVGGLDYVEFSITTDDAGFLAGSLTENSAWFITGLNWGPGSPPGVAAGLIFLSFDSDGTFLDLDGTGFGVPIVPNPGVLAGVHGAPSVPLDISGDPVDAIPFDVVALTDGAATSMGALLIALGMDQQTALSVNSMHIGFEVTHIPEPATLALLGVGLCSTLLMRRKRG